MADIMRAGGLNEAPGKTWLLVSGEVGCKSRRPALARLRGSEEGVRKVWLRRIVIDTFSRDQGWSDQAVSYGTSA